jgi:hypothetical protein
MTTQAEPKKLTPPKAPARQLAVTANIDSNSYAGLMTLQREGDNVVIRISAGPHVVFIKCERAVEVFDEADPRAGDREFLTPDGHSRSY